MTKFKGQQLRKIRSFACSKNFNHYHLLMQHRPAKHQDKNAALVQMFAQLEISFQ